MKNIIAWFRALWPAIPFRPLGKDEKLDVGCRNTQLPPMQWREPQKEK